MNMPSVASRNGAPRITLMLISTANCGSPPVNVAPKITVTGIMVFGKVVPTAASTRLWLSPMRSSGISTVVVNNAAIARILATESRSCRIIKARVTDFLENSVPTGQAERKMQCFYRR
jgi:hypothetical protein